MLMDLLLLFSYLYSSVADPEERQLFAGVGAQIFGPAPSILFHTKNLKLSLRINVTGIYLKESLFLDNNLLYIGILKKMKIKKKTMKFIEFNSKI
jgi:hypothetical protein